MHPMLRKAIEASRLAGEAIRHYSNKIDRLTIQNKDQNDFVSEVDRQAEQIVVRALQRAYPDHTFLGEEGGRQGANSDYEWVIDPLDGTTNFLYGIPHFSVFSAEYSTPGTPMALSFFSVSSLLGNSSSRAEVSISPAQPIPQSR